MEFIGVSRYSCVRLFFLTMLLLFRYFSVSVIMGVVCLYI